MIVIVSEKYLTRSFLLRKGDAFNLTIDGDIDTVFGKKTFDQMVLLEENFTKDTIIDWCCIFIFADDKTGKVLAPNFCGFFGHSINLPDEIVMATRMDELAPVEYKNFMTTAPFK